MKRIFSYHYTITAAQKSVKKTNVSRIEINVFRDEAKNGYMKAERSDREKNLFVIANRAVSMPRMRD